VPGVLGVSGVSVLSRLLKAARLGQDASPEDVR
jgi:hypothetical protein